MNKICLKKVLSVAKMAKAMAHKGNMSKLIGSLESTVKLLKPC